MKKKMYFILAASLMTLLSGSLYAQFSRQQAINLVMNIIIGSDSSNVLVYAAYNSKTQQEAIILFDYTSVSCPFSDNWVFFINDDPAALWYHPCRFIFVNCQNGAYRIVSEDLNPNNEDSDYELISFVPSGGQISFPDYTGEGSTFDESSDHLFAVLVGGTGKNSNAWQWFDISMVYNTLLKRGYKKENIFVHFAENDGTYGYPTQNLYLTDDLDGFPVSDDIDFNASIASLGATFEFLSQNLGHDDQLLVHFEAHGNTDQLGTYITIYGQDLTPPELLYDYQLAGWLESIDCAQMVVTIMSCLSGGFIDDLTDYVTYPNCLCKNRQIYTACDNNESAHFERHITGGRPVWQYEVYGEFTFYLYSALRGEYPDVDGFIDGFEPWLPSADLGAFEFDPFFPPPEDPNHHPDDYDPDIFFGNSDFFIQVGEAFAYMDDFNTWSPKNPENYGYWFPQNGTTEDHPKFAKTGLFIEDLLTLGGLTGDIINSQTITGNFLVADEIRIHEEATLTLSNSSEFYFMDEVAGISSFGDLIIGSNVLFQCIDNTKQSYINTEQTCNISVGANITLSNMDWIIDNSSLIMTINSGIFNHSLLQSNQNSLTLNSCTFNDGEGVVFSSGNLTASGCHFYGASLRATSGSAGKWVTITSQCQFTNAVYGVYLDNYPNFNIQYSTFSSNSTGIRLFHSGTGSGRQLLNNTISSNGTGIKVYNSFATLTSRNLVNRGNKIYYNNIGLQSYDNSQVSLIGYAGAATWNATQYIKDNTSYEVEASQGSFPVPFKYNAIIDEDNTEQMLYYTGQPNESLDVRYNYWGVNIDPQNDFYPWQCYNWLPDWVPGGGGGGSGSGAESLYLAASENIETEEYAEAKEGLEQIVDEYPETEYAKAAMKELYAIEEYTGDNYSALKYYYNSNSVIQGDSSLIKLAGFLANFCEIKLENWPTALAWFEDVVENPETMEDSIFAIIDMGYTYWLMENGGLKSTYTGTMPQYKFASQKDYEENRDYLLSLLPGDGLSETMKQGINALKAGELLQNVPNPFNGTTQIWFKIAAEADVNITVYDYTGKEISDINSGMMDKGSHSVEFRSENLPSGIYFYTLEVNGLKTEMKKMTIMK
jgi:hypothetical protein